MTIFKRAGGRLPAYWKLLACWLALSVGAACLPGTVNRQLKDQGRRLLAPGQRLAWSALKSLHRWGLVWQGRADSAEELLALRERVERLEESNQALRAAAARREFNVSAEAEQPPPLVGARAVETRVLGRQAQRFLEDLAVITIDKKSPLSVDSLALDRGAVLVDQGENALFEVSALAVTGARVWGKIVEVGPQTAVVRRVNARGYRGLVQIISEANGERRPMAEGVLEGRGGPLCRVRMVEATAPVSVGDLVIAAEEQGLTDAPLVYGRIARSELEPGSPHWQLWMTPAIADDVPAMLTVLEPEINTERMARGPKAFGRLPSRVK